MSHLLHVHTRFESVGHGCFVRGWVGASDESKRFHWIYDCGSKRPSILRGLIEAAYPAKRGEIDLLCLSHFDADHINGLDLLLEHAKVKRLVLPYVGLSERLRLACSLSEEESSSAAEQAALTASPLTYFARRHEGRIDHVTFVQGGSDDFGIADSYFKSQAELVDEDESSKIDRDPLPASARDLDEDAEGYGDSNQLETAKVSLVSHSHPWSLNLGFEFKFYNSALPAGLTPQSGKPVSDLRKEVEGVLDNYEMWGPGIAKRGWEKALRSVFDFHFGGGSHRRNAVSLCLFAAPSVRRPCAISIRRATANNIKVERLEVSTGSADACKDAVLLTGDIALTLKELDTLFAHLGTRRSVRVHAMQIPHHGSRHSWQAGNSVHCGHRYSVLCSPEPGHNPKHPHEDVLNDLPEWVVASYDRCVDFGFEQV